MGHSLTLAATGRDGEAGIRWRALAAPGGGAAHSLTLVATAKGAGPLAGACGCGDEEGTTRWRSQLRARGQPKILPRLKRQMARPITEAVMAPRMARIGRIWTKLWPAQRTALKPSIDQ